MRERSGVDSLRPMLTLSPPQNRQQTMAPKKTVAKKEEDGSNSHNKASSGSGAANSNKSAADRVIAVTAAEGYTGSALLELLASDQFKGSSSKLVGLTFGEPKDDVKAILEDAGIETMMVDEIDEKMIKQLGVDTLCLIPPANKVRRVFIRIRLSGRWRFSACHGALIAVSSPDRTGENGPRQADPHPRKEGQVGPERRTRLFGRCRLRRARQAATPPRVYRPRGTNPVSAVTLVQKLLRRRSFPCAFVANEIFSYRSWLCSPSRTRRPATRVTRRASSGEKAPSRYSSLPFVLTLRHTPPAYTAPASTWRTSSSVSAAPLLQPLGIERRTDFLFLVATLG